MSHPFSFQRLPRSFAIPTLVLFGFVLAAGSAAAQVVTFEPAFPSVDEPVTVYFHADEGTGGLAGYTGDVYAHTGVITDRSTTPGDWKYVKTSWGQNTPDTKLERIGTDLYRLVISDIRTYYGIPSSEQVLKLAFVFRSGAQVGGAYLEGKGDQNTDIFITLYESGVNVRIAEPATDALNPLIADRDTTVDVMAVAGSVGSPLAGLKLLVNGAPVSETANDTLVYSLALTSPGRVDVTAIAISDGGASDTAAFYAVRNPDQAEAALPAGIQDGINYDPGDPTKVTLSLYAPGKDFVYVVGDFSDWEVDPAYLMNRDEVRADSVRYWITLDGLEPGREYAFQYLVDGMLRMADLFSPKVLVPGDDASIGAATYPDLKPYPQGKTTGTVSVFRTGQEPFAFTAFARPAQQDLVIYELLLRDFLAAHDFETLTDTLDYLDRLGVNAVELMPVSEFDGNLSWGYNPTFHLALDKYYGPAEDLKRFVDEAHKRGIAVIMDVVYNHAHGESPLVQLYGPTGDNPYINIPATHPFNVFYDLNHENPYVQYWLDRANAHWLEDFDVDGFRIDLAGGFMQTGDFFGYNPERVALLTRMAEKIWETDSTAYVILEDLIDSGQEYEELTTYGRDRGRPGALVWHNMNQAYSQSTMGYLTDAGRSSDLSDTYPSLWVDGIPVGNVVTYMDSHDEQWLMYRNLAYGNGSGSYQVKELATALERQKLAGAFFFTVPGPRMIWQFGELGYGGGTGECLRNDGADECPSGTPGRVGAKPIRWEYRTDPLREKLYKTWAALLKLRNENALFTSPSTQVVLRVGQGQADRWIKLSNLSLPESTVRNAVIVGNFGVVQQSVAPGFPEAGTWYDYFTGDPVDVTEPDTSLALLPGEFHIYTDQYVEPPEPGLITVDTEDEALPGFRAYKLGQNYPNPFRDETTISYAVPKLSHVKLVLYDLLGRQIAVLVDSVQAAGPYQVSFDARHLSGGMYVYRLEAEGHTLTRKMLLVK